jgi:predicted nuclease of predicted toxin-antitoxin system
MRILLDECLPQRLGQALTGHEVVTVPQAGWAGRTNGELLALAEGAFDHFMTIDQHMVQQQDLRGRKLSVSVISSSSNRLQALTVLVPALLYALEHIQPGQIVGI